MNRKTNSWRRIGQHASEFTRADYNYEEIYVSFDKFRLCKMASANGIEGKWLLFSPIDRLVNKCVSPSLPWKWADGIVDGLMN